jgi:hypothetical protein
METTGDVAQPESAPTDTDPATTSAAHERTLNLSFTRVLSPPEGPTASVVIGPHLSSGAPDHGLSPRVRSMAGVSRPEERLSFFPLDSPVFEAGA